MIAPRPCPFCGKDPEVGPADGSREGNAFGYVQCVNSKCPTSDANGEGVRVDDGALFCDDRGRNAYRQLAVRRWNKRNG